MSSYYPGSQQQQQPADPIGSALNQGMQMMPMYLQKQKNQLLQQQLDQAKGPAIMGNSAGDPNDPDYWKMRLRQDLQGQQSMDQPVPMGSQSPQQMYG